MVALNNVIKIKGKSKSINCGCDSQRIRREKDIKFLSFVPLISLAALFFSEWTKTKGRISSLTHFQYMYVSPRIVSVLKPPFRFCRSLSLDKKKYECHQQTSSPLKKNNFIYFSILSPERNDETKILYCHSGVYI